MSEHKTAVVIGCTLIVAGAWVLHQTYDKTGRKRPFALSFLP